MRATIQKALKKAFSPEFLNRLDDIIVFNSLKREHIHEIIDISLSHLTKRIGDLGYKIELSKKAKDFVAEKGYDPQFGARPLNRAIQKYLEDPIAEEILKGELAEGDILKVDFNTKDNKLVFSRKKKAKSNSSSEAK